ncbi:MAG: hypothetical protein ACM3XM_09090, partial [Mycobacterium leprae]
FSAIERIMNAAQTGDQSRPLIVSAHTVYMLKDRLMEGLTRKDIEAINPDMVVTLVDSPQNIHRQLRNQSGEYFRLPMELIVRWQEFEVFYSNHLAKDYGKPHYVVPVSQAESFRSLLQHNNRRVVYLTYPATNLSESDRGRVTEFINQLKQRCVVFDPAAIANSLARNPNYDLTDYSAINSYTRVRDLEWLIGINADAVVAYLPKVVFSSSMNDELRFAYENGRPTYLITELDNVEELSRLTPFTTYKSQIFWSKEDYFEFMTLSTERQRAFLPIQAEMLYMLQRVRETGEDMDKSSFRAQCRRSLFNLLSDEEYERLGHAIDEVADRVYDRWDSLRRQLRTTSREVAVTREPVRTESRDFQEAARIAVTPEPMATTVTPASAPVTPSSADTVSFDETAAASQPERPEHEKAEHERQGEHRVERTELLNQLFPPHGNGSGSSKGNKQ